MDPADIVGLVSGIIGIFTFLTGFTSARELFGPRAVRTPPADRARRTRLRWTLGLSAPVFLVSMVVTLSQGLAGSDTGGTQFLLLAVGAVILIWYALRLHRTVPWRAFFVTSIAVLCGLGFLAGTISRGEEAEGAAAGLVVGSAISLLGFAFRGARTTSGGREPGGSAGHDQAARAAAIEIEHRVLRAARALGGDVSASDVALGAGLALDDARRILNDLAVRGHCERRITPSGAAVYRFADFQPR